MYSDECVQRREYLYKIIRVPYTHVRASKTPMTEFVYKDENSYMKW